MMRSIMDANGATQYATEANLFVATIGDRYEPEIAQWMTWDGVVTECCNRAARVIASDGHFAISSRVGAFVCHN